MDINKMFDNKLFVLSVETETNIFTIVHMFAMSTTITNPILYGWLNTNLKHLFRAMIPYVRDRPARSALGANGNSRAAMGSGAAGRGGPSEASNNSCCAFERAPRSIPVSRREVN